MGHFPGDWVIWFENIALNGSFAMAQIHARISIEYNSKFHAVVVDLSLV